MMKPMHELSAVMHVQLDTGLATNNAGMFGESDEDEDLLPVRAPQHQEEEEDEEDALIDSSAVALGSAAASKHQEVEEQDLVGWAQGSWKGFMHTCTCSPVCFSTWLVIEHCVLQYVSKNLPSYQPG